jgi:hypothetical protein
MYIHLLSIYVIYSTYTARSQGQKVDTDKRRGLLLLLLPTVIVLVCAWKKESKNKNSLPPFFFSPGVCREE